MVEVDRHLSTGELVAETVFEVGAGYYSSENDAGAAVVQDFALVAEAGDKSQCWAEAEAEAEAEPKELYRYC